MFMEKGDTLNLDLEHITADGKGVSHYKGKTVIVEEVEDDDESVRVEIDQVLEETIITKKTSKGKPKKKKKEEVEVGPYEIDTDDEYEDEDDEM